MKSHKMTQKLLESSIRELQFSKLQTSHYEVVLDQIRAITTDKLVKNIINNAKQKRNLDIGCHWRSINK